MVKVKLTPALRDEYTRLFDTCVIRPERAGAVEAIVGQLARNRGRYERVGGSAGIPWHFIAVVHNMEASQNFACHLHNGDPLTARTRLVPAGHPRSGSPPFTWETSCADALALKKLGSGTDWSLPGTLYQLEGYNGWGYRRFHPHVLSPYLWSFSTHYRSGKYVADGTWSDTAVSKQCGAAVILRRMAERGLCSFTDQPAPGDRDHPLVAAYSTRAPADPSQRIRAELLQAWLNTHPGIFLKLDGIAGSETSTAFRKVTGSYLPGDPRR